MNKIIILFLILSLFACSSSSKKIETNEPKADIQKPEKIPSLVETKWRFKIVDSVYNIYEFKPESNFKYLNAELEDTFYGSYKVENDTLYVFSNTSVTDSLLSEESPHRSLKTKSKLIMKDGSLILIHNEYKHATGWVETRLLSSIIYERVE
ncbi:MAG: hypothetical protein AAF600_13870 [Bacteroidota bacterium]